MFFLMLLTLGLDSLFGALESVTTALKDVRGLGRLPREALSGEHQIQINSSASFHLEAYVALRFIRQKYGFIRKQSDCLS